MSDSQSCWFTASEQGADLIGAIFPLEAVGTAAPLAVVRVFGRTSTPFVVPPGRYRYEFNITSTQPFTLTLFVHGTDTPCSPAFFDPSDPTMGAAAAIDRKCTFEVVS